MHSVQIPNRSSIFRSSFWKAQEKKVVAEVASSWWRYPTTSPEGQPPFTRGNWLPLASGSLVRGSLLLPQYERKSPFIIRPLCEDQFGTIAAPCVKKLWGMIHTIAFKGSKLNLDSCQAQWAWQDLKGPWFHQHFHPVSSPLRLSLSFLSTSCPPPLSSSSSLFIYLSYWKGRLKRLIIVILSRRDYNSTYLLGAAQKKLKQ